MAIRKRKYWTIGQIDATGVRGPHEKELEDISNRKSPLFKNININQLKELIEQHIGGKIENIGFNEDWTITIPMFPEVYIHIAYTYFGNEFGDTKEAEFKFYFSGDRVTWIPGEDSATYIDIVVDFIERLLKAHAPFEKAYDKKTELMEKVLKQRATPFAFLKEEYIKDFVDFIGAKVWKTIDGWRIKREFFPNMFVEITWNIGKGLDITFSGKQLMNLSSYHAEFLGIFTINQILRFITIKNENKQLPDICYIMFSRMFTKEKGWEHRTR
jgi:hypothetical protein